MVYIGINMLSMTRVSTAMASDYYSKDDYYLETAGQWQGELGRELGFEGKIREDDFHSLIAGKDPNGKFQIQSGGVENKHTAGVDLTFSAPKSVSIAGLVLEDKQVIEAHNKAVSFALNYVEKNFTHVREKVDRDVITHHTGNMLTAKFQHISSRELDPQLHTHCLVMNFTKNEKGEYRAMDYHEMFETKMLMGQIYRSELSMNLKELGYEIETDSRGLFEIKGISKEAIDEFSKRSKQIEERFQELKKQYPSTDYAKLKDQATQETRKSKDEPSREVLHKQWDERIQDLGLTKEEIYKAPEVSVEQIQPKQSLHELISKTMSIATETDAVVARKDVLRLATKLSMTDYRVSEIEVALNKTENVICLDNGKAYTTTEIVNMEQKIVDQVTSGKDKLLNTMLSEDVSKQIRAYEMAQSVKSNSERLLTIGQRQAVDHILSSKDRIIAIQGDAGTGKTTMLDCVRNIRDASQPELEIVGLSFTGKAASEIEEASQIRSSTIASMIRSDENLHGKVVVVDEASMLSIRDMNAILNRCDENTKLVLIGDTKQLQSFGQGKIFSTLQEKGFINTIRMSETIRQSGSPEYKDIVDTLSNREVDRAYNKLQAQNAIKLIKDRDQRLDAMVNQYLKKSRETIIVTASNKDRDELNSRIRQSLVSDGRVSIVNLQINTRESVNLTGVEKLFIENYNMNDVVVANIDVALGKKGAEAKIIGVDRDKQTITVQSLDKQVVLDVKEHGGDLQIYREKVREFAHGDKILFLKNDKQLGVKNGQTAIIQSINQNSRELLVKLENGNTLNFNPEAQYKHIGHGYAITDYKSQGQTAKHVIYHADTNRKVTFNQAYVGITRGKQSVTVYTNDSDTLRKSMRKDQIKTSTLDYKIPESIKNINTRYTNPDNIKSINKDSPSITTTKENESQHAIDKSQGMER